MGEFDGKVVFVTGAASGVGAATARLLAERGGTLVLADSDSLRLSETAAGLSQAGIECLCIVLDVTDPDAVDDAVGQTVSRFGALHLAVNCAGITGPSFPAGDYPRDDWRRIVDVNLNGLFYSMQAEIRAMVASRGGAIVNVASIIGVVGMKGAVAYAAAKHGVIGVTKAAALDYSQQGVRINAVAPGYVDTPMINRRDPATMSALAALQPMHRLATAKEVAELSAFLLSERASFITGSVHMVDGGYTAR